MARRFKYTNPIECWNALADVLTYGKEKPFLYKKSPVTYILHHGIGSGKGYHDESSEEYLMDDIQHALFSEGLDKIHLHLSGLGDGPITDCWTFTFTKAGLVEVDSYYNDD